MLKIKDWQSFQHYKDRNPPWIKLQTDTFQNYEFSRLQSASKLLAICIWTLASRSKDGSVPHDFEYIKTWGQLGKDVTENNLKELINKGYLIDASNPLAGCKQSAIPETYREETETETEKEKERNKTPKEDFWEPFGIFWQTYPRKEKRADAYKAYVKALKKASHDEIIAGVERYRKHKPEYADWAHPTSWLNAERWNDNFEAKVSLMPQPKSKNLVAGSPEWELEMGSES